MEYIEIGFPGNQFNGDILPALQELVDSGTIRILDLLVVSKDAVGNTAAMELGEVVELEAMFAELDYQVQGLFNEDDIEALAAQLPENSTGAIMVWENVWAEKFAEAVRGANGMIIDNARIPHDIVQAAFDYVAGEN
jgi:hypothetical protein